MILELEHVYKDYMQGKMSVHILKDISLSVEEGEYLAIMGPSGSGKTTLMNIIGCLDKPTSGSYHLNGKDVLTYSDNELSDTRLYNIGFVFQSFHLLPKQTALENVYLPLIYAGISKKERIERATEALERVGLGDRLHFKPTQLSGGQQQRVAIARAIVNHPTILLADEPTGALDSSSGEQVMELFQKLNDEGITIIMITHQMEVVQRICNHIAVMSEGKVIEEGTVKEIFTSPQHSVTKSFIQEGKNHNEFDETVLKKIYSKGRLLKVVFDENVSRLPILTKVIRECDSDINVIEANLSNTIDSSFGIMILQVIGDYEKVITLFEKYLAKVEVM